MPQGNLGLHPALQSFISAYTGMKQMRQREDQLAQNENQRQVENDRAEKIFQQKVKEFENDVKYKDEDLKLKQEEAKLQQKARHLQARQIVSQLVGQGKIKPNDYSQQQMQSAGQQVQPGADGKLPEVNPDMYNVDGYQFSTNEIGNPQEQGQAALDLQRPSLDYKNEITTNLHDKDAANRIAIALQNARARMDQEAARQKFTGEQNELNRTTQKTIAETRERGANARTASTNATRLQAAQISGENSKVKADNKPKTSTQIKEEEKQQANDTFDANIGNLFALGEKTKWSQQGKFGETMGKARDSGYINPGSEDEQLFRSFSGKVFGKQAFSEAGKSMTKNELAIIQKYATDLSKDPKVARTRINDLLNERGIVIAPDGRILKKQPDGTGRVIGTVGHK